MNAEIIINRFRCKVRLGVGQKERRSPQWVAFDLSLRLPSVPKGCLTDEISDTVCYDELCKALKSLCAKGEYRLMEKLGHDAFQELQRKLPPGSRLRLKLTKEKTPVPNLTEGASFRLSNDSETDCCPSDCCR